MRDRASPAASISRVGHGVGRAPFVASMKAGRTITNPS